MLRHFDFRDLFSNVFGRSVPRDMFMEQTVFLEPPREEGLTLEKKVSLQHEMLLNLAREAAAAREKTTKVVRALNSLREKHVELVRAHNRLLERVEALEKGACK